MGKRKHTIESVKEIFKNNKCELLANTFVDCSTVMEYICECNNKSFINLNNFQNGRRCKNCGIYKRSKTKTRSYQAVSKECASIGLELLTSEEEYNAFPIGSKKFRITVSCERDHILTKNLDNLFNNYRNNKNIKNKYGACIKCYRELHKGHNHHWYTNGSTSNYKFDRKICRSLNSEWKIKIHNKDDWKCKICNRGTYLTAHHLNGYGWDIENRYNVDNGITLCPEHHTNFHQIYGNKNNTKEQFEQYYSIIEECQPILEGQIGIPLLILEISSKEEDHHPS